LAHLQLFDYQYFIFFSAHSLGYASQKELRLDYQAAITALKISQQMNSKFPSFFSGLISQ